MQQDYVSAPPYVSAENQTDFCAIQSATSTSDEERAVSIALMQDKVVGAKCFIFDGSCVVAIIIEPIYLKSERDRLISEIKTELQSSIQKSVIVTCDVDVYTKIKTDMSSADKSALYKKVTDRL